MDDASVHGAVIHPPSWDPGSVEMAFDAVRGWPGRFAIMGSLPLDKPDETRAPGLVAQSTGYARLAMVVLA